MSKQLIFVFGAPYSGRTTWINKTLLSGKVNTVQIDANNYPSLYTNSKLSEESIEASRKWCLEQVNKLMCDSNSVSTQLTHTIILSLIACRADKWRDFIQLAILNQYEIIFKFPSNKLLFYVTKHNSTMEQYKFIESKCLTKYPRDTKEVKKSDSKDSKNTNGVIYKETNESTLLKNIVTEFESGYAFYLENRMKLGFDKEAWLKKINEHYKATIIGEIKRAQRKIDKETYDAEKAQKKADKEAKKLTINVEKTRRNEDKTDTNDKEHTTQTDMVSV